MDKSGIGEVGAIGPAIKRRCEVLAICDSCKSRNPIKCVTFLNRHLTYLNQPTHWNAYQRRVSQRAKQIRRFSAFPIVGPFLHLRAGYEPFYGSLDFTMYHGSCRTRELRNSVFSLDLSFPLPRQWQDMGCQAKSPF